ncbi:MAG TPA: glycosyltransferase family 4 protein [Acetobacteraceae bacterium]|jgi:glycosyltransferase involved in cell wall biosynthesis|nr:glycosyltransferase family 4 protein [Acetobacteraceae bacterium]
MLSLLAVCTLPPWPPLNGYTLRVAHLLEHLSAQWSITLIAPPLDAVPAAITRHVPITLPASGVTYPWRFDQAGLRATLDRIVAGTRFDRALIFPGAEALWFARTDLPPAVVDIIDCNPLEFWRGFLSYRDLRQRYRALREIAVATRYARRTVRSYAATVCAGEADARWLRRIGGRGAVHMIPNGVEVPSRITDESSRPTLIFTGALDYQPNIEAVRFAAKAVWPRIIAARPDARFVIAGRDPVPSIRTLSSRTNVEIAANVPDMAQVLGESWVAIAPMRSGVGIKNKVLEAWACARPVVMSRLATNGLNIPSDHASLVAATPGDMAEAVLRLLDHAGERHRLGRSARDTALRYTWAAAATRIDGLLRHAARENWHDNRGC